MTYIMDSVFCFSNFIYIFAMIKKFEIFESKWNKYDVPKYKPRYKVGDICIWSYNKYDIPYKYNEQECEIIKVPINKDDGYQVKFDDTSIWYCDEVDLRLMTEDDMQNYVDNLSKIGKIFYWIWNPIYGIPEKYANSRCKLVNIGKYGHVIEFFLDGAARMRWICNPHDLKTEKEMSAFFARQEEMRKKYQDVDPYGEEIWEKYDIDPYNEEDWDNCEHNWEKEIKYEYDARDSFYPNIKLIYKCSKCGKIISEKNWKKLNVLENKKR